MRHGAAANAGRMLSWARCNRKSRPKLRHCCKKLEVVPLKTVGGGTAIDVEALIRRHPVVCFIDGLAYDNPPGLAKSYPLAGCAGPAGRRNQSDRLHQHSIRRRVAEGCRGHHRQARNQTVPLSFIQSADEIEIVDAPPEEPMERSAEEQAEAQKRERAFVEDCGSWLWWWPRTSWIISSTSTWNRHGIRQQFGAHERILVCITPRANMQEMMEIAQIVAQRFHGELIVAYVNQPNISPEDQSALDARLAIASAAGAHIEILEGRRSRGRTSRFRQIPRDHSAVRGA